MRPAYHNPLSRPFQEIKQSKVGADRPTIESDWHPASSQNEQGDEDAETHGDLEDAKNVLDQFAKYLRVRVRFLDLLTEGLPPDAINRGDWLTAEEADGRFQRACELEEADVEAMAEMMNDRDGLKHAVLWTGKKMGVTVTGMRRLTATLDESLVPQGMTDARAQGLAMLRDQSLSHDEVLTEPRPGVLSLAREMIWLHPVDAHQPSARGRSCPTPKSSSRI